MLGGFNFFALSGILAAISGGTMALIMFTRGREWLHRLFGMVSIAIFFWGFGSYKIATTSDPIVALFWARTAYIGVILLPALFLHFVYVFLGIQKRSLIRIMYAVGIFFEFTNFIDGWLMDQVRYIFDQFYYIYPPTPLYNVFFIYFIVLVIYSHILLFKAFRKASGVQKIKIEYFFIGMLVGFVGGSFSFLPVYHIDFYPIFNNTVFLFAPIIGYAILKHGLFDLRVAAAVLATIVLLTVVGVEIFLSSNVLELVLRIIFLFVISIFGVLLVRSVLREIRQREEIEKLAKDLETANEKLRKLDEVKSEFISLAGHQLRAPLTVIKGYTSMLMEGTFGEISKKALAAMERVFISANNLTKLVSDLLDLSRIESGRMKYEFKDIYLDDVVEKVLKELEEVSKEKRIAIEFKNENKKTFSVFGDADKLYEAVINLLDNALKYSTASPILVSLKPRSKRLALSVADKGMGIPRDEMSKLFIKFGRTEIAKKERPDGMGLGLYFVKRIVDDHKGRIWAESGGLGKGSTFFVELPVK